MYLSTNRIHHKAINGIDATIYDSIFGLPFIRHFLDYFVKRLARVSPIDMTSFQVKIRSANILHISNRNNRICRIIRVQREDANVDTMSHQKEF